MAIECDIIRLKRADSGKLQSDCSYFRYALIYPLEKCMEDNNFQITMLTFAKRTNVSFSLLSLPIYVYFPLYARGYQIKCNTVMELAFH